MLRSPLRKVDNDTIVAVQPSPPQTAVEDPSSARQASWSGDHPINLRLSIPFGFGRYYLTIIGGRERRSASRLVQERRRHPLSTLGNLLFLGACGTVLGLAALAVLNLVTVGLLGEG